MTQSMTPQTLVELALESSRVDDCVVIAHVSTSANLRWANNSLTTNGVMTGIEVTVIAFSERDGQVCTGSVTGSATTKDQVTAFVAAADAAALAASPAEDAAPLIHDASSPDWADPPAETSISVFSDVAPGLGESFQRAEKDQRVLYGFVEHRLDTVYVGSSRGLRLRHVQPTGHYACTAKPTDRSRSAWVGVATDDFRDVDPVALDAEVARRLGWGERQQQLPAGRYDTILPPSSVADLMIDAYWYSGARTAYEGQSAYSRPGGGTRIGEQLVRPAVNLFSDPTYPGLRCQPFTTASTSNNEQSVFDNGLGLGRTDWITAGRLTGLMQTRHSASLMNEPVTPYVDNLVLDAGGSGSLDDLVANTERGLLLTCLWYIREVDPQSLLLTGLTRDGVYLIEDGEITAEVNNFRWNESPLSLLNRFSHASETVRSFSREWGDDYFNRTATPALRIPDFNMSSVSQAK